MTEPGRAPDNIPTPVWIWVAAAVLFAWIVVATLCQQAKCAEPVEYPEGSVLFSRNLDPRQNGNWGWLNHTAIYVGQGQVAESQIGLGVILTPMSVYEARPYQKFGDKNHIARVPKDAATGQRAALAARSMVGTPYRPGSSLPLIPPLVPWALGRDPSGLNCVSLVSKSYAAAGWPWFGRTPDDLYRSTTPYYGPYGYRYGYVYPYSRPPWHGGYPYRW